MANRIFGEATWHGHTHGVGGLTYDVEEAHVAGEFNVFLALDRDRRRLRDDRTALSSATASCSIPATNVDAIFNEARLQIIILQVSIVGIIAIGVTQVIITGGIDLSSGSIVGATAMIAMSFRPDGPVNGNPNPKAIFLTNGPTCRSSCRCLWPSAAAWWPASSMAR